MDTFFSHRATAAEAPGGSLTGVLTFLDSLSHCSSPKTARSRRTWASATRAARRATRSAVSGLEDTRVQLAMHLALVAHSSLAALVFPSSFLSVQTARSALPVVRARVRLLRRVAVARRSVAALARARALRASRRIASDRDHDPRDRRRETRRRTRMEAGEAQETGCSTALVGARGTLCLARNVALKLIFD